MPLKKTIIIFLLLIVPITFCFTQQNIDVSARFYDKELYRINGRIYIKIEIINNSPAPFRFELSDYRVFNIDFDVRTLDNQKLPHTEKFIIRKNTNQPIFFRQVTLETGERYGFIEDLTDYVQIEEPGAYKVTTLFFPELNAGTEQTVLRSNTLELTVRPPEEKPDLKTIQDYEKMAQLQRRSLSPDEVVSYTIEARQQSEWEKFFLYLDLESLLRRNPAREREYLRLSEEDRRDMLQEYKDQLKNERVDGDIVVIPQDFSIIKTTYTPTEGTVKVRMEFEYPNYTEIKEYTYYVRRRDDVWFIYDYEVRNLGTE